MKSLRALCFLTFLKGVGMDKQLSEAVMSEITNIITARGVITDLVVVVIVFIASLGLVYLLGRMFGFVNSMRGRNLVGLIGMIIATFSYVFILDQPIPEDLSSNPFICWLYNNFPDIARMVVLVLAEVLVYMLVGAKLYSRVDSVLDKHIGEDIDGPDDAFAKDYEKKIKKKS